MIKKLDNNKPQATYQQRMNLILDYIERHLDESLTLEKISQQANFSSYHFHRQFRVYTGHPAYKLIQLLRLKRAAKKLAFSNTKSITEIAFNASFENTVMDRDVITLTYDTMLGLMRDLKAIGAHNVDSDRHKGLFGKNKFNRLKAEYDKFRWPGGELPATYEVIFGHAWKRHGKPQPDYHTYKVNIKG